MAMASKKAAVTQSLVESRQALGMNQTQFWGRIGVTQSAGSRYESGRHVPTPISMLLWLIDTHRVSEKDLATAAKSISKK
jgi:DNA-binding transcriptional regulator YiaG